MAKYEDLSKEDKVKKEKRRLTGIFKEIEEKKKKTCEGLIEEAAFMRATLFDLKAQIDEDGVINEMQQGKDYSIIRQHPALQAYNTTIKNYKDTIKQLVSLLPEEKAKEIDNNDGFEGFVEDRD